MYNGIGLTTPRGSGTNGYVQRNLSFVRKTKEKIKEQTNEDTAVRAYDPALVEHERRRQIEVRCLELRELLEEQKVPDEEIEEEVATFRAKLVEEKKDTIVRDSSGRPMLKDSHELAMAQESKNERAKNAFGIRDDFVPGSSLDSNRLSEQLSAQEKNSIPRQKPDIEIIGAVQNAKQEKKKRRRSRSSSNSSADSSDSYSSSSSSTSKYSDSSSANSGSEDGEISRRKSRKRKKMKKSSMKSKSKSRRERGKNGRSKPRSRSSSRNVTRSRSRSVSRTRTRSRTRSLSRSRSRSIASSRSRSISRSTSRSRSGSKGRKDRKTKGKKDHKRKRHHERSRRR